MKVSGLDLEKAIRDAPAGAGTGESMGREATISPIHKRNCSLSAGPGSAFLFAFEGPKGLCGDNKSLCFDAR